MQNYVKFSAMPSLQVQAGHCSDHHRHRHCHHHRHRGEPALSQSMQFPISLHLHCQKEPSIAKCSNAKQASEMIKLASIETTAPNFSASKRMSVQISVYLQGRCEGIEKQGKVHHGTALLWLWCAGTIHLPFQVSFARNTTKLWTSEYPKTQIQVQWVWRPPRPELKTQSAIQNRGMFGKSDVLSKNQVISLTPRPCWPHRLDSPFPINSRLASGSFLISGGTSGAEQGETWLKPWSPGLVGKVLCWHNVLKIEHLSRYKQAAKRAGSI